MVAHPYDLVACVRLPRAFDKFFEWWWLNLLVFAGHMHRCHSDKLKFRAANALPHKVSVDQINCDKKCFLQEPQSLHVPKKPFDENSSHLWIYVLLLNDRP